MDPTQNIHDPLEIEKVRKKNPKNLPEGVLSGASAVVKGAVGGLGVALLAPTVGFRTGAKQGGIVEASTGLIGGAAVGVVGAAVLIVGGAVAGAMEIGKGVAAVPASIAAPREGKWWNDATSTWVYTDMTKLSVPDNDDDILGSLEEDTSTNYVPSGDVKDMGYYDALGVEAGADAHKLKKQYYLMARNYHPDKHPDDPVAAEKFKAAAEAYQVLSDPALRARYDAYGKQAVSNDQRVEDDEPDPALLLAFLFGSDKFHGFVGRLATSTIALVGDATKLSPSHARILQERRCTRLAMILIERIKPWMAMKFHETELEWMNQVKDLQNASYGWELLQVIGMAYELAALRFLGSNDSGIGRPSIKVWANGKMATNRMGKAKVKNRFQSLGATLNILKVMSEYEKKIQEARSPEQRALLEEERANASTSSVLEYVWTAVAVDIASTIHEACQMVFFDQSVGKEIREMRAKAVKALGKILQSSKPRNASKGSPTELFQEASLAATLETIKRREETRYQNDE